MDNIRNHLPDLNRLSITVSTILLAYTLTHFMSIPPQEVSLTLLGIFFSVRIPDPAQRGNPGFRDSGQVRANAAENGDGQWT